MKVLDGNDTYTEACAINTPYSHLFHAFFFDYYSVEFSNKCVRTQNNVKLCEKMCILCPIK